MWEVGTRKSFTFSPGTVPSAPRPVISGKLALDRNPHIARVYNKENFKKSRRAPSLAHTKAQKREMKMENFREQITKLENDELFTS